VCGFANSQGGYLIIGAERRQEGDGYVLPGVKFHSEAGPRLSSIIRTGLDPVPPFDVKVWERPVQARAVVVRVGRIAEPPCVTASGVVYERTSGQTVPVIDPAELSRLFERGKAARSAAETVSQLSVERLLWPFGTAIPLEQSHAQVVVAVALAAVGGPPDRAALLFSAEFAEGHFLKALTEQLRPDVALKRPPWTLVRQDAIIGHSSGASGTSWSAQATWDGAVTVAYESRELDSLTPESVITRASLGWRVAAGLLTGLGGHGAAHLVLRVRWDQKHLTARDETVVRRWTLLDEPVASEEELSSVERELRRSQGETAWEPSLS
jgi:hypothetical protein